MTFKQLFDALKNHDIYDTYVWAIWFLNPERVSCVECVTTRKSMSGKKPDCSSCIPTSNLIKKHFKNNSGKGDQCDANK